MRIPSFLSRLLPPRIPQFGEEDQKAISREIISTLAEGNLSLFHGNYVSQKDFEAERQVILDPSYLCIR